MKNFTKKVLATMLSLCFILSAVSLTAFAKPEFESRFEDLKLPDDYAVTAIVVFDDPSLSELGYTPADIQAGKADSALTKIEQKQSEFADRLNGKGDVCYKYSSVLNGVAVETNFSQLKAIEKMDGVKDVYIANTYEVPEVESGNEAITGAIEVVKNGYDGDGVTIAVLDTGTHTTHEAFQDYGIIDEPAITKEMVDNFEGYATPKYISTKIPFAYDYADGDDDVTDINPATGGHGTHCAGIALGYAERDGEAYFTGTAPAAQLVAMKIFKDDVSTTNSGIYFAALDDCYTLGVDIVSMSIGSNYGFTYDRELEDEVFGNIFKTLDDAGIIVCASAGNSGNQSENSQNWLSLMGYTGYVLAEYTDYGVVGSPATYMGNIGVASIQNTVIVTTGFKAGDGTPIPFFDNGGEGETLFDVFGNDGTSELEIAFIDGVGEPSDYEGIDVKGKVVFVSRGTTTFSEKEQAAYEAGAAAVVVYNNQAGYISMQIDSYDIPAVSTTYDAAMYIKKLYYEGYRFIIIEETAATVTNDTAYQVSSFSSWGPTADMRVVPHIAGVGGYVYSASYTGDTNYELMSGTSMACPNVAGMFALVLDALRDQYPDMDKKAMSELAENKALSTAAPTTDAYDSISPVAQQGSGIFQPEDAIGANYYFVDPISDGVGNASAEGVYTFDITVARTHGEGAESFELTPYIMTDYPGAQNFGSQAKPDYHIYNTMSSLMLEEGEDGDYTFTVNTESGKVEFADGETEVTVSVTITLAEGTKQFIETYFANGIYVYGYIYLDTDEGEVAPHSTFLGFYGDFAQSTAVEFGYTSFEMIDFDYILNTVVDDEGKTYYDYGYRYYYPLAESDLGYTMIVGYGDQSGMGAIWHLGGNVFESIPYDAIHNAISSAASETGEYFADNFVIQPIVYRNLRHLVMTVTPEGYDAPVYTDDTEYVRKSSGESDGNYSTFMWGGEIYDADGEFTGYVESGTNCTVKFYAQLDFEGAELEEVFTFDVIVDYEAPEFFYHYDAETREITYSISDNHLLQYFEIYDEDLTTLHSISAEELGEMEVGGTITGSFTVPEGLDAVYYSLMDYATNYVESGFATDVSSTNVTWDITSQGEGYAITPETEYCGYDYLEDGTEVYTVFDNSTFKFSVDIFEGYTATDDYKVFFGDTEIKADEDGIYSVVVTEDTAITVEGVCDITAPEIEIVDPNTVETIAPEEGEDTVTISGNMMFALFTSDAGSGVKEFGYAFSDTEYDISTPEAIAELIETLEWTADELFGTYGKYGVGYIYAYAIDEAGNIGMTSIKISNDTKAPTFSAFITEHGTKAIVSISDEMSDIASVTVDGVDSEFVTVSEAKDSVTIAGMPNGTYEITVTAEDAFGNVSQFAFTLEVEYVPELITDDLYLVGLHETQTVADLKAKYLGSIAVLDKDGNEMADDEIVTTGCTITYCGSSITIIVKGDVNKDGKVSIIDSTLVRRSIMGYVELDDEQLLAATVAGGNKISIRDYTLIKRHIQGFISIYGE